jgi:UDP-N-acetylglucosamine 4,6-dehydratase
VRRVLVTGGTGTFGRAFIRRLLRDQLAEAVVSYSRDEQKVAALYAEFGHERPFKAFLGDIRDTTRLGLALRGVDTVVHAAALKRVDVGAYSPSELIATNINGTMNLINAAIHAGVSKVVVLSSDKAVAPINLYGATKYCAETYAVQANSYRRDDVPRIAAVRYGNILGSRGSVIGIWREQAAAQRRLTLTHPDMTRFIMTIEQAADLVLFAIDKMLGGEVFLPRLPSAYMVDLARAVVPHADIEFTGLRPGGEKMAERLLNDEEVRRTVRSRTATPCCRRTTSGRQWGGPGRRCRRASVTAATPAPSSTRRALRALIADTEACR